MFASESRTFVRPLCCSFQLCISLTHMQNKITPHPDALITQSTASGHRLESSNPLPELYSPTVLYSEDSSINVAMLQQRALKTPVIPFQQKAERSAHARAPLRQRDSHARGETATAAQCSNLSRKTIMNQKNNSRQSTTLRVNVQKYQTTVLANECCN